MSRDQVHKDKACDREISKLQCFCTNENLGCAWVGHLSVLQVCYMQLSKKVIQSWYAIMCYLGI